MSTGPSRVPTELIAHIVREFVASERSPSRVDLKGGRPWGRRSNFSPAASVAVAKLCLVSREWYRATGPLLARYLTLQGADGGPEAGHITLRRALRCLALFVPRWRDRIYGVSLNLVFGDRSLLDVAYSSVLKALPHLCELRIDFADSPDPAEIYPETLETVMNMHHVRTVTIMAGDVGNEYVPVLDNLLTLPLATLRHVTLKYFYFGPELWACLPALPELVSLKIVACEIEETETASPTGSLPKLRALNFHTSLYFVRCFMKLDLPALAHLALDHIDADLDLRIYDEFEDLETLMDDSRMVPVGLQTLEFQGIERLDRMAYNDGLMGRWLERLLQVNPAISCLSLTEEVSVVAEILPMIERGDTPALLTLRLDPVWPAVRREPAAWAAHRSALSQRLHERGITLVLGDDQ